MMLGRGERQLSRLPGPTSVLGQLVPTRGEDDPTLLTRTGGIPTGLVHGSRTKLKLEQPVATSPYT